MEPGTRERRIRLQEKHRVDELRKSLIDFVCYETYSGDILSPTLILARKRIATIGGATPVSAIRSDADPDALRQWLNSFIMYSNIGRRFYINTTLIFFPWLDCEINGPRYVDALVPRASNLWLISNDKTTLASVSEEEHEDDFAYVGYVEHTES